MLFVYNLCILLVQTKDVKSPKSPKDIPVAEGLRSIKSMWEKGNVQSPTAPGPASPATLNKVHLTECMKYCAYKAESLSTSRCK